MTLNYIWAGFFLVGFAAALAQWIFLGDTEIFKKIIDGTFDSARRPRRSTPPPRRSLPSCATGVSALLCAPTFITYSHSPAAGQGAVAHEGVASEPRSTVVLG